MNDNAGLFRRAENLIVVQLAVVLVERVGLCRVKHLSREIAGLHAMLFVPLKIFPVAFRVARPTSQYLIH